MTERELLVDCLRRLNGVQVSYMLTDSMASNYWGIPRFRPPANSGFTSRFAGQLKSD